RVVDALVALWFLRVEKPVANGFERTHQLRVGRHRAARLIARAAQRRHLERGIAKYENIVGTHVIQNFDIRTVQRANRQGTIERQLHVPGTRSFGARRRDLFRQVRGRDDQFGEADAVVGYKYNFEHAAHPSVRIDDLGHVVDQANDELGHMIGGSRLARKYHDARHLDGVG